MLEMKKSVYARINLLKIVLIIPVIIFHSFVGLIGIENLTSEPKFEVWNSFNSFFSNSFFASFGFYITCLSFFTYGFKAETSEIKSRFNSLLKYALLVVCILGSQFDFSKSVHDVEFFSWNLYSFIILSFVLVFLLKPLIKKNLKLCFYSFLLLFVVASVLSPVLTPLLGTYLHSGILQVLIPYRVTDLANSWFLIPWIFGPLLFYAAGARLQISGLKLRDLITISMIILAAGIYYVLERPVLYPFSLVLDAFYMNFFWQPFTINILKVFGFCVFLLVFCSKYFQFLEENAILRKLRFLQWCRHFWFCYILHLGIKDIIGESFPQILNNDFVLSYVWLIIFFATELLAQMFFASLFFYRFIFRRLISKLRVRNL